MARAILPKRFKLNPKPIVAAYLLKEYEWFGLIFTHQAHIDAVGNTGPGWVFRAAVEADLLTSIISVNVVKFKFAPNISGQVHAWVAALVFVKTLAAQLSVYTYLQKGLDATFPTLQGKK